MKDADVVLDYALHGFVESMPCIRENDLLATTWGASPWISGAKSAWLCSGWSAIPSPEQGESEDSWTHIIENLRSVILDCDSFRLSGHRLTEVHGGAILVRTILGNAIPSFERAFRLLPQCQESSRSTEEESTGIEALYARLDALLAQQERTPDDTELHAAVEEAYDKLRSAQRAAAAEMRHRAEARLRLPLNVDEVRAQVAALLAEAVDETASGSD